MTIAEDILARARGVSLRLREAFQSWPQALPGELWGLHWGLLQDGANTIESLVAMIVGPSRRVVELPPGYAIALVPLSQPDQTHCEDRIIDAVARGLDAHAWGHARKTWIAAGASQMQPDHWRHYLDMAAAAVRVLKGTEAEDQHVLEDPAHVV